MNDGPPAAPPDAPTPLVGPPVRLGRTLRFAARAAWDSLGLVCLASLTIFLASLIPISVVAGLGVGAPGAARLGGWGAAWIVAVLVVPPLYAGACWMANVVFEHDEPGYADLWRGARSLFGRALLLGAIQQMVTVILLANLVFYLSQRSFLFLVLTVLFLYALAFWAAQAIYHFPLLVAADRGLLRREESGRTPLTAIFRNALVLSLASPGYSFALAALLAILAPICLATGAGMALIFPGFAAFLTMQATRDQLARFGHLQPPEDPNEPLPDERWRVQ